MRTQQRIYKLVSESGKNINPTDTLLVAINGIRTEIKLMDLFETYKQSSDRIKGHSFLEELPNIKHRLLINEGVSLSIINKNNDEEIFFGSLSYPIIQSADLETDDEKKILMIENEFKRLFKKNETEEILKEIKIEEPTPQDKQILDLSEQEEKEIKEEEVEEEVKEEVKQEVEEEAIVNSYLSELKKLEKEGYKEFAADKYRALYNEETKMFIFAEVENDKYSKPLYETKKDLDCVIITVNDGATLIFDYNSLVIRKKSTKI